MKFRGSVCRDLPQCRQRIGSVAQGAFLEADRVNVQRQEATAYSCGTATLAKYGERMIEDVLQMIRGSGFIVYRFFVKGRCVHHDCSRLSNCTLVLATVAFVVSSRTLRQEKARSRNQSLNRGRLLLDRWAHLRGTFHDLEHSQFSGD